jgi:hypothetical protein
LIVIGVG